MGRCSHELKVNHQTVAIPAFHTGSRRDRQAEWRNLLFLTGLRKRFPLAQFELIADNPIMSGTPALFSPSAMRAEKRAVAGNSVAASLLITGGKIVVGVTTGSLGILSEAAHSALDLIAALLTYLSVGVSDKPADADHQYGHGKIENFSAFVETGLLLLTCLWVIYEAIMRLFFRRVEVEPTVWAFLVMLISMAVDWWRSRALGRIANKYDSQALEADALHFSTDVWSAGVVVLGLILVLAGRIYHLDWLRLADPIAALFVAGVIVSVSWRLARRTVDALLDAAPVGVRSQIIGAVSNVEGVLEIGRVRIRRAGNHYFADLAVGFARSVTFERSQQLVQAVITAVRHILPDADVTVQPLSRAQRSENLFDRIRAVAARRNLNVHDISVQDFHGELHVEQHLELDERMTLKHAHDQVTELEAEMRRDLPGIATILTHIESEPATIEKAEEQVRDANLERRLKSVAKEFAEILDVHEFVMTRVRGRLYVSCHCTLPDNLPLMRVHEIQTELEIRFKQAAPELFRVLIHPEPSTDNRR
jgi:cation diffusion facilitator family transporter